MSGRGPTDEVESGWLGAEALPGGIVSADAETGPSHKVSTARARGPAAWLAAALRWTRRRRSL